MIFIGICIYFSLKFRANSSRSRGEPFFVNNNRNNTKIITSRSARPWYRPSPLSLSPMGLLTPHHDFTLPIKAFHPFRVYNFAGVTISGLRTETIFIIIFPQRSAGSRFRLDEIGNKNKNNNNHIFRRPLCERY